MSKKKKIISFCYMLLILVFVIAKEPVYAESKQAQIITTSVQEDLTVMFSFDEKMVDITFISPSGTKKTSSDSDVEYSYGDLWSTYRISKAEVGTWSVEYILEGNTEISYSIIEDNYGLWIQYLNIGEVIEDKMSLTFQADFDSKNISYQYEVYALSMTKEGVISRVASGRARSNEEREIEVKLSDLSSDNYIFKLDVYYQDNGVELFDYIESEEFIYSNPNEPNGIEDYKVKIDIENLTAIIDWSDYANWRFDEYRLTVNGDGQTIYTGELDKGITLNSIIFEKGTKTLEFKLSYKNNNVWSKEKVKIISLLDQSLYKTTGDISNSLQLTMNYKANKDRLLYVNINGQEGTYEIKNEGMIAFDLIEGSNDIYAEIESEDLVSFIIDASVYCDVNPPKIKLYEDLDGKTFYSNSVTLIGKITGGNILRILGEELEVEEDGDFLYEVDLSLGENVIDIEAEDRNGNISKRALTLYKGSNIVSGTGSPIDLTQFLPLLVSFLASIVFIVLSIVFMKKKEKTIKVKSFKSWWLIPFNILLVVLEAGLVWKLIALYRFNNSLAFLNLAEVSSSEAAKSLKLESIFSRASGLVMLLLIVSGVISFFIFKRSKGQKK